jgi:hypothetical protein
MNLRRETAKMEVPPGNPQGLVPEAYSRKVRRRVARPEDSRKDGHIRGRSRRFITYSDCGRSKDGSL